MKVKILFALLFVICLGFFAPATVVGQNSSEWKTAKNTGVSFRSACERGTWTIEIITPYPELFTFSFDSGKGKPVTGRLQVGTGVDSEQFGASNGCKKFKFKISEIDRTDDGLYRVYSYDGSSAKWDVKGGSGGGLFGTILETGAAVGAVKAGAPAPQQEPQTTSAAGQQRTSPSSPPTIQPSSDSMCVGWQSQKYSPPCITCPVVPNGQIMAYDPVSRQCRRDS